MKKSFYAVVITLICVLSLSIGITFFVDWLNNGSKTFSQTKDLTSLVSENMSVNDIASLYMDACVTVYVPNASMGSGVCIAASGYKTQNGYTACKGAYFATNYHVVERAVEDGFPGTKIIVNDEGYSDGKNAQILWSDKDLDMAILYCNEDLYVQYDKFGYVTMKDRVVDCKADDSIVGTYENNIFTIGTPLNLTYRDTLTIGHIKQPDLQTNYTLKTVSGINVVDNVYENILLMDVDMSAGNSGGGVFDKNGYLIGLATLSIGNSESNTNPMNFFVPIYPLTFILDKVVEFNENFSTTKSLISMTDIGIYGLDAKETAFIKQVARQYGTINNCYYIDGRTFNVNTYAKAFNYDSPGFIILSVDSSSIAKNIPNNFVITQIDDKIIADKNDFIYAIYSHKRGDTIKLSGINLSFQTKEYTITL